MQRVGTGLTAEQQRISWLTTEASGGCAAEISMVQAPINLRLFALPLLRMPRAKQLQLGHQSVAAQLYPAAAAAVVAPGSAVCALSPGPLDLASLCMIQSLCLNLSLRLSERLPQELSLRYAAAASF